jgi:hypothetical protein
MGIVKYLTSDNYLEYTNTTDTSVLQTWSGLQYSGQILINQILNEDINFGQLCYKDNSTDGWQIASATISNNKSYNMLGICLINGSSFEVAKILTSGYVVINGVDIVYGDNGTPLYMSTNYGRMTSIAPTSSGNVVRIIGYNFLNQETQANGLNIIYFNPDNTWIEL